MEKKLPNPINGDSRFIKNSRLITSDIVSLGTMYFSFHTNVHNIGAASAGSIINIGNSDSYPVN